MLQQERDRVVQLNCRQFISQRPFCFMFFKRKGHCPKLIHSSVIVCFLRNELHCSWKTSNEKPLPISFGVFEKKEGDKKRTKAKCYPFISHLSFWRKSTPKKRTLTDELPTELQKLKYFKCCLIDLFVFLVWPLLNRIWYTLISGVKSSWTSLYIDVRHSNSIQEIGRKALFALPEIKLECESFFSPIEQTWPRYGQSPLGTQLIFFGPLDSSFER